MANKIPLSHQIQMAKNRGVQTDVIAPPKSKRLKNNNEESRSQKMVIKWWSDACIKYGIHECLLFAIPNGAVLGHGKEEWQKTQRAIRGRNLKLEGLRPGTFDLFLSVPRFPEDGRSSDVYGLYIEMKTSTGVLSTAQIEFWEEVKTQGYKAVSCRSAQEAIECIKEYLANTAGQPRPPINR